MSLNQVEIQALRSYAGKANHVATLVHTWRPFLDQLWTAISGTKSSNAPSHEVWVKQIASSLSWLQAFLRREQRTLERRWRFDYYSNQGRKITLILDASPFGLGGVLLIDGQIAAWLADALTSHDELIHGHAIGEDTGQQTWESLVVLVAVKLWGHTGIITQLL